MAQTLVGKSADQVHNTPEGGVAFAQTSIQENIRIAEGLVRTLEEQDEAVRQAYERGWRECGESLAYIGAEQWMSGFADGFEAGRVDMQREVDAAWTEVAARAHYLGSPLSRTYAENRAEEIERLKPQPNDFMGLERDPEYIERCRVSMESITCNRNQRAA